MGRSVPYIMLISSLPHLPSLFTVRETPLSRLQLNRRLRMLEAADAVTLRHIQTLMSWSHPPQEISDPQLVDSFERLMVELDHRGCFQTLISSRFELLTVVAALRRRQRGESAPTPGARWGDPRWVSHIGRHWDEPAFGLEVAFPWILDAARYLEGSDPVGLERLLMTIAWQHLARASEGHYFDFAAVVIYTLRFELIEYWSGWDKHTAKAHFQELLEAGYGDYRHRYVRT